MHTARQHRLIALRDLLDQLRSDLLLRDVCELGIARIDAVLNGQLQAPTLQSEMADLLPRLDRILGLIGHEDVHLRSGVTACVRVFRQRTTGERQPSRRERWQSKAAQRVKEREPETVEG